MLNVHIIGVLQKYTIQFSLSIDEQIKIFYRIDNVLEMDTTDITG